MKRYGKSFLPKLIETLHCLHTELPHSTHFVVKHWYEYYYTEMAKKLCTYNYFNRMEMPKGPLLRDRGACLLGAQQLKLFLCADDMFVPALQKVNASGKARWELAAAGEQVPPEGDAYTAAAGGEAGISTVSSFRAVTEAEGQRSPFLSPDSVPAAGRGAGSSEKPLCSPLPRGPAARSPRLCSRVPLGGRGAAPLPFPAPAARACAPLSAPLRSGATGGFSMERRPPAAAAPRGGESRGVSRGEAGPAEGRGAPAARSRSEASGELLCLPLPELSPGRGARSARPTSRYARLRRRAPSVPASPALKGIRAARRTDRRRNGESGGRESPPISD